MRASKDGSGRGHAFESDKTKTKVAAAEVHVMPSRERTMYQRKVKSQGRSGVLDLLCALVFLPSVIGSDSER